MLNWLLRAKLEKFERHYDYDATFMHDMLGVSPQVLMAFHRATSLANQDAGLPKAVLFAAKITTLLHEDCGPCTQLNVQMAREAGLSPQTLVDIVRGRTQQLPREVADTVEFVQAVQRRSPEADAFRQRLEERYGRAGIVALGFNIVVAKMYPTMKYSLGHGKQCQRVMIDGNPIVPFAAAG